MSGGSASPTANYEMWRTLTNLNRSAARHMMRVWARKEGVPSGVERRLAEGMPLSKAIAEWADETYTGVRFTA